MAYQTLNYEDYEPESMVIGTGGIFPIELKSSDRGVGYYPVIEDIRLIQNNLQALIEYNIGQRFRQEYFGTRLQECLEEPNSQALTFMVKEFLLQAFSEYETRITLKKVVTDSYQGTLHISFTYVISDQSNEYTANINI